MCDALQIVKNGLERRNPPFMLSSGAWSQDYVDISRSVSDGKSLRIICQALLDVADRRGWQFSYIGGPVHGAEALAIGIALLRDGCRWFSTRHEDKVYALFNKIEGAVPNEKSSVLLVDDVVTSGASHRRTYRLVKDYGCDVAGILSVVDRTGEKIVEGVAQDSLFNYEDLGIEKVEL